MARRKPRVKGEEPWVPFSDKYIWVRTKETHFWRRKRGTLTPVKINESFRKNVNHAKIAGPAAKKLVAKLSPFLQRLKTGRITMRFCNFFIKTLNQKGQLDFSLFKDYDVQERNTVDLLLPGLDVRQQKNTMIVTVPIYDESFPNYSSITSDYYYELILVQGDPSKEKNLRIEVEESALYPFETRFENQKCQLQMELPDDNKPWVLFFKASCMEGNKMAVNGRHYGMKVIAVG